jgi:hypothetical protein
MMRQFMMIAAVPLAACSIGASGHDSTPGVAGTGSGTTRTFAVSDFTGIDLRGADDVDVRVGTGFSVRAEGPAKELDRLKIARDGDTLRIGRIDDRGFHWGRGSDAKVTVYVTMPRIVDAGITGSGDLSIDRVEGQDFNGATAGSGSLKVAALSVQNAKLDVAGSGNMALAGAARRLSVSIAGPGDVDAGKVKADTADVSIAGSGGVRADVTGTAKVSLMGSGDVDLGASAKCSVTKIGSGNVRCGS